MLNHFYIYFFIFETSYTRMLLQQKTQPFKSLVTFKFLFDISVCLENNFARLFGRKKTLCFIKLHFKKFLSRFACATSVLFIFVISHLRHSALSGREVRSTLAYKNKTFRQCFLICLRRLQNN